MNMKDLKKLSKSLLIKLLLKQEERSRQTQKPKIVLIRRLTSMKT